MSREDFVTEPADVPILQIQFRGEGAWLPHVRCFSCEQPFEEGVLSFYLDELPLCWGCAPPMAKTYARVHYGYVNDEDTRLRLLLRGEWDQMRYESSEEYRRGLLGSM